MNIKHSSENSYRIEKDKDISTREPFPPTLSDSYFLLPEIV